MPRHIRFCVKTVLCHSCRLWLKCHRTKSGIDSKRHDRGQGALSFFHQSKQTIGCLGSCGCSYRVNTFSMFQIYSLVMLPMHHRCLSHGFISFFLMLCKRSFLRSSQFPPAQQACRPINSSSISIFLPADLSKQGQSV